MLMILIVFNLCLGFQMDKEFKEIVQSIIQLKYIYLYLIIFNTFKSLFFKILDIVHIS